MEIGSVETEADLCRKAFKDTGVGTMTRHWFDTDSSFCAAIDWADEIGDQIKNITNSRLPDTKRAEHLHLFRPIIYSEEWPKALKMAYARLQKAYAERENAKRGNTAMYANEYYSLQGVFGRLYFAEQHDADCPDCPCRKGK